MADSRLTKPLSVLALRNEESGIRDDRKRCSNFVIGPRQQYNYYSNEK